ncbi:MAG: hypothetical protein HPY45_13235 [Anaerolineae bacterium]|nr:hypothetical protein [Anaerolineae bacterium]
MLREGGQGGVKPRQTQWGKPHPTHVRRAGFTPPFPMGRQGKPMRQAPSYTRGARSKTKKADLPAAPGGLNLPAHSGPSGGGERPSGSAQQRPVRAAYEDCEMRLIHQANKSSSTKATTNTTAVMVKHLLSLHLSRKPAL